MLFQTFDSIDELLKLTGMKREKLWAAGFETDDLDFGLVCDEALFQPGEQDGDCLEPDDEVRDGLRGSGQFIARALLDCGKLLCHVVFQGRHWYLAYHS